MAPNKTLSAKKGILSRSVMRRRWRKSIAINASGNETAMPFDSSAKTKNAKVSQNFFLT